MSYKVEFINSAKENLKNIALTIIDLSNDKQIAKNYINGIKEKVNILKDFPETGLFVKDRNLISKEYRFLTYKKYIIFYTVDKSVNTVYVRAIINLRTSYTRALRDIL